MIFGHHVHSIGEFIQLVNEGKWDNLLLRIKIKPGDLFYVPSGTIPELCKGIIVLETQQSSDTHIEYMPLIGVDKMASCENFI